MSLELASLIAGSKESVCNAGDPGSIPGSGRSAGEGIGYPLQYSLGFPCGSASKESAHHVGDLGSVPGLGRSPGKGKGYPLQYPGLENSMDCIVHGVGKSRTWLSDFHFHTSLELARPKFLYLSHLLEILGKLPNLSQPVSSSVKWELDKNYHRAEWGLNKTQYLAFS